MKKELNSEVEDLQLARACLDGNEKAQKRLFEKYSGQMMAVCLRYGSDHQEAEDMFQDGFIKVFQKLEKYNGNKDTVAQRLSTSANTVYRLLGLTKLVDKVVIDQEDDIEHRLTNNKIPLREFYELNRISDQNEINKKFQQLENKYSTEPKEEPVQRRATKVQDGIDKALTFAKKIRMELQTKTFSNDDARLQELKLELERIIADLSQPEAVSHK